MSFWVPKWHVSSSQGQEGKTPCNRTRCYPLPHCSFCVPSSISSPSCPSSSLSLFFLEADPAILCTMNALPRRYSRTRHPICPSKISDRQPFSKSTMFQGPGRSGDRIRIFFKKNGKKLQKLMYYFQS